MRDDAGALAIAVAVVAGAWWSGPVPLALAAGGCAVALLARHHALLVVAAALLAAALGHHAHAGLDPPPAAPFEGEVLLVDDPEPVDGAVRAEVKAGSRRLEAWARGPAAAKLGRRSAGERVSVSGSTSPALDEPWLTARHVVGELDVTDVSRWDDGNAVARAANWFRHTLARGAEPLPATSRVLFTGFVLGDDRGQRPELEDDFRGAGLTHLLAVSGQNVAFVLALAAPVLARLEGRWRWIATMSLLGGFALITRFEPSVLRATAMAAVSTTASLAGRPSTSLRYLSLAVAGLVLADPFLVHSVGFGLSVAASLGIIVLAAPLASWLPGPGLLVRPLSVTLAAQAGVAPLVVPLFGGLPVASLPANLLVEPVAGMVMVWGLTAGVIAGLAGDPLSPVLHVPTRVLLWWVEKVAHAGAGMPLGELQLVHVTGAAGVVALAVAARRWQWPRAIVPAALVVATAVVLAPALSLRLDDHGTTRLPGVGRLLAGGGSHVLVLEGSPSPEEVLREVRRRGVDRLDLVVSATGAFDDGEAIAVLRRRVAVGSVWAPAEHRIALATTPPEGVHRLGGLALRVVATAHALDVGLATGGRDPPR